MSLLEPQICKWDERLMIWEAGKIQDLELILEKGELEPECWFCWTVSCRRGGWKGEIGDPSLLWESPLHASWIWAANCKFHSTSSMEGLSTGSLTKHLLQISIVIFNDSSEYALWTAESTKFFRAAASAVMLACNCSVKRYSPQLLLWCNPVILGHH